MKLSPSFTYLRTKISEWREGGMLIPPTLLNLDRFRLIAQDEIVPVVQQLVDTLTKEGMAAEILVALEENPCVGVHIPDYGAIVYLWPSENPAMFNITSQGYDPTGTLVRKVSYRVIATGCLAEILQEAVLRLISPPRQ